MASGKTTSNRGTTSRPVVPQACHGGLVLASASPRRRKLLTEMGAQFEAITVNVDERPAPSEAAEPYARRVARAKAFAAMLVRPGAWILAADTTVEIDGLILGKPADETAARVMLSQLSGQTHRVLTAVTLVAPDSTIRLDEVVSSTVRFHTLSAHEIEQYVATGEPLDKAGAYAVQGDGARFVEAVEGSYSSVVGLPIELVSDALAAWGLLP